MKLTGEQALRYLLWSQVIRTANANRQHFGLPTTWIFHGSGNTLALLLPEIYRGLAQLLNARGRAPHDTRWAALDGFMRDVVLENPRYAFYMAPLAIGYSVSHPKFNIYTGKWAETQLLGFSFDSIPHAATAYTLTRLGIESIEALARHATPAEPLVAAAHWANDHRSLVTGVVVLGATIIYETSEFLIHRAELKATGGDYSRINMQWGVTDTITDVISNWVGWLLGLWTSPPPAKR